MDGAEIARSRNLREWKPFTPASLLRQIPSPGSQGRNPMDQIIELLQKAARDKFWGQVEITFHDGVVNLVKRTETFKIDKPMEKNPRDSRYSYNRSERAHNRVSLLRRL